VSEEGQEFENLSKKVSSGEKQISPLLASLEKLPLTPPPLEKFLPMPMHTSM